MPFVCLITRPASEDVESILLFLEDQSEEVATRFEKRFDALTADLCQRIPQEIAQSGKPFHVQDEPATLRYSRPVYRERLEMNKRRARRSSSGLWYVYYTLEDRGRTGSPDTVVILRIRHSAARPFSIEEAEEM